MQDIIRQLLAELGENPSREGLIDTPKRVEKAFKFLTSGYTADVDTVINNALFTVDYNEMVIVKDIDFYSLTSQIAETIRSKIEPLGVAVVIEATHLCMAMRGVEKQNSFAITSAMLGGFQNDARTRMEFLELIRRPDLQSRASQCHSTQAASSA